VAGADRQLTTAVRLVLFYRKSFVSSTTGRAVAEEPNTNTASVTPIGMGPAAVTNLTGVATSTSP
jgi:hypothetical protein